MTASVSSPFREVALERAAEWVAKGHKRRHFFPHRVYHLPKCGPDGFQLARSMCGVDDPAAMWELVLYADPATLAEFPTELFFDDELIWHRQQFGRPGQVASANLVVDGAAVYSVGQVSDLVQRIPRRREHKTRVEKVFKGWNHMLLNAVLSFAQEHGARRVYVPTSDLFARHTDAARQTDVTLFGRIYDRTVNEMFPARRSGEWWVVDLADAGDRLVTPERRTERRPRPKTICVCHHVERGLGHLDFDTAFARRAERSSPRDLEAVRRIEAELGVRTTYCVVGSLLSEVRDGLEADGHCLAFHSFDHRVGGGEQLLRCRELDYRIKGYRAPYSEITEELTDRNLLFHNFEWMASGPSSLDTWEPRMGAGLVRFPTIFDDFPMHQHGMSPADWERAALDHAIGSDFAMIGLHDCYAPHWLDRYRDLLERLAEVGDLRTLDEAAAEITLASAA